MIKDKLTQKGTRNYNSITNRRRNCDSCKENYLDLADMTMPSRLNILELKMIYEGANYQISSSILNLGVVDYVGN